MYIDIFFTSVVLSFSLSTSTCISIQKIINTCMFSLFQHFVFSLSLLFFEKKYFFAFCGFILWVFFFFLLKDFYYFHIFSGKLKYVRVWGINKAKSKKPCKKSIFFSPESKCHL